VVALKAMVNDVATKQATSVAQRWGKATWRRRGARYKRARRHGGGRNDDEGGSVAKQATATATAINDTL